MQHNFMKTDSQLKEVIQFFTEKSSLVAVPSKLLLCLLITDFRNDCKVFQLYCNSAGA